MRRGYLNRAPTLRRSVSIASRVGTRWNRSFLPGSHGGFCRHSGTASVLNNFLIHSTHYAH